ncbi:MAG: efflux RND transporter periplasmic adaptor subunit [Armatimonadota bacterium]
MRRRWKLILYAVVLPLVLLGGCGALVATKFRPKPDEARTAKVERGDVVVAVRETGTVEPIKKVEVKSKVAGKLAYLGVDEGDRVEAGQVIARLSVPELEAQRDQVAAQLEAARARLHQSKLATRLDRETIEAQVKQAEASLRAARAAQEEASTRTEDARRVHDSKVRLFEMGGYVSQNDVDSAKAALDLASQQERSSAERVREQEAGLALARARRAEYEVGESRVAEAEASARQIQDSLTEIESRLADAVIMAPSSGVVIARHIREGELITAVSYYGAGAPIVTIGDLSTMLVKVDLNEVDVDKVRLGLKVDITADALPGRKFTGRVTRISPASVKREGEPNIVRFPIEITVDRADDGLKPGMTANVEVICRTAKAVLWVPNDAVFEKEGRAGKKFVSVVTSEAKGRRQTKDREVKTGLANEARTEIVSGLRKGEKVELDKAGAPKRKTIDIRRESEREE